MVAPGLPALGKKKSPQPVSQVEGLQNLMGDYSHSMVAGGLDVMS